MKLLKFFSFLIMSFLFFQLSWAQETRVPCRNKDGSIGFTLLDNFDCDLVQNIIKDPKINAEFRDDLRSKLASNLALKTNDALEEIGLLDAYFDQLGLDLSKDSNEVKSQCRLDVIAKPNCLMNEDSKKKMEILSSFFPKSTNNKLKNNALLSGMIAKSSQVRGGSLGTDINKCPALSNEGFFFIESQLGNQEASTLISLIKEGDSKRLSNQYKRYPQLKMISEIPELKNKFELEMSKYPASGILEKDYIENFIKKSETQIELAKKLADKCKNLKQDIDNFLCLEPVHLAMPDEERDKFYGKSDIDQLNKVISKGLSCKIVDSNELVKDQTISFMNNNFTKDLRKVPTKEKITAVTMNFCEMYSCKDKSVSSLVSCKNGGPVKSKDLLANYCTNPTNKCNNDVFKYISYLALIEKDFESSNFNMTNIAQSNGGKETSQDLKKPTGYSSFYQNFLGVEGTLAVEGKSITPATVAAKVEEFKEKKLDPALSQIPKMAMGEGRTSPSQTHKSIAGNKEMGSDEDFAQARVPNGQDTFIVAGSSDREKRELIEKIVASSEGNKTPQARSNRSSVPSSTSNTSGDLKDLQAQIASVMSAMKGSEGQKLDTIVRNNDSLVNDEGTKSAARSLSSDGVNEAERERLRRYRESLNAWENRLQNWSGDLNARELQVSSAGNRPVTNSGTQKSEETREESGSGGNKGLAPKASLLSSSSGNKTTKNENEAERSTKDKFLAEDGSFIVNSENLPLLGRETLSEIGILSQDSFVLSVRHQKKIYAIPVQKFNHKGKNIFVPLLNEKNRDLAKIVLESPLFSEYRKYRAETEVSRL